ncbi:DNA/RNA polymerases superfamily protein [Gossypium australe]|uniref:DNA/RNA polymerases superfamily protein n=1 Tax=Gossypium australe TaxID=47621 RepID=A0A5B6VVM8_9ROSI|nr:DNA/RNA polymerases superfamily protein [Gossypium australe]
MKHDLSKFVPKCLVCQQVTTKHQVPSGLLQPIMIPEWKWERVTMDIVSRLPLSPKKKDAIWVIIDRLTKSAHFIPVCMDFSSDRLPELYTGWSACLHYFRQRSSICILILEQAASSFGYAILEDVLRCCVLEFEGNREKYLPLVEFTYNKNYQSSIKMTLYEALYGCKCRNMLYWIELSKKKIHGVDLVCETEENVKPLIIKSLMLILNEKRYNFRSVIRKLSPLFIRLYEIIKRIKPVAYRLGLPPELEKIHNIFHVSMLRRYQSDPSHVISLTEVDIQPDMTYSEEPIKILARSSSESSLATTRNRRSYLGTRGKAISKSLY